MVVHRLILPGRSNTYLPFHRFTYYLASDFSDNEASFPRKYRHSLYSELISSVLMHYPIQSFVKAITTSVGREIA